MRRTQQLFALSFVVGISSTPAIAQPPTPRPGPDYRQVEEVLKQEAGTWNTTVEVFRGRGREARTYKSVTKTSIGCGGRCLISDYKTEIEPGKPFHGHGIKAYDPAKKKYVESWTDAMNPGISTMEYTYDRGAKTFRGSVGTTNARGAAVNMTVTSEFRDANTRVVTWSTPGLGPVLACSMVRVPGSDVVNPPPE